jgi:hypothetical protein
MHPSTTAPMGVAEGVDDRALAVAGDEGAEVPYGSAKVAVGCLPADLPGGQRAQNPCRRCHHA